MVKFLEHMFANTLKGRPLLITIGIILYLWILWEKEKRERKKAQEEGRLRKGRNKKFKFRRCKHGRKHI